MHEFDSPIFKVSFNQSNQYLLCSFFFIQKNILSAIHSLFYSFEWNAEIWNELENIFCVIQIETFQLRTKTASMDNVNSMGNTRIHVMKMLYHSRTLSSGTTINYKPLR